MSKTAREQVETILTAYHEARAYGWGEQAARKAAAHRLANVARLTLSQAADAVVTVLARDRNTARSILGVF